MQNLIHCIFGAGIEISALFFSIIINRVDCCKYAIAVGHTRVWQITANMRKKRGEKMTEKEKIRIQTSETFFAECDSGTFRRLSGCLHLQREKQGVLECADRKRGADEPASDGR